MQETNKRRPPAYQSGPQSESQRASLLTLPLKVTLSLSLSVSLGVSVMSACSPLSSGRDEADLQAQGAHKVTLGQARGEVIYGEDTRVDVFEAPEPLAERARRSIFAMIPANRVNERNPNNITLNAGTLSSSFGVCSDQRFADQVTAASCSATLIDDDLLVTAGHCIGSLRECQSQRFVLGYQMEANGLAPLTSEQVFSCQSLLATYDDGAIDYAFVRLDRAPNPMIATPAPVRTLAAPLTLDEPLTLMGFPSGLPLKIDAGGFVSDPRAQSNDFFKGTVDSFGGNSGSGVFNEAGEQVGILVRGEQDYVRNRRCMVVNELNLDRGPGESAEEITYLHRALSALCATGYESDRLCLGDNTGGLCSSCGGGISCDAGLACASFSDVMSEVSFCAPRCDNSGGCPAGHICAEGQCEPTRSLLCGPNNTIISQDSCGRVVSVVAECGESAYCERGSCVLRSEGDVCELATRLEPVSQSLSGTLLEGYENTNQGACGGAGPERFYSFTLEAPNHLTATSAGFDTVMYLRTSCEGEELACDDDGNREVRLGSLIDLDLPAGDYVLALDSFNPDTIGDYTLELSFCDGACALGESRCTPEGLLSVCEQPEDRACPTWSAPFDCPDSLTCSEGSCVDVPETCEDACDEGAVSCVNLTERQACVLGELGCRVWAPLEPCAEGEVCTFEGECLLEEVDLGPIEQDMEPIERDMEPIEQDMEPTEAGAEAGQPAQAGAPLPPPNPWVSETVQPQEIELERRARGGCDQEGGGAPPALPALALMGVVGLVGRRRRERG